MKTQNNELLIYGAVKSGELEIDKEGKIWRVSVRVNATATRPCHRRRAESDNGRYLQVKMMCNGARKYAAAHRLVWIHFHGPIPEGFTINHKNGITKDNKPENLELATASDQMIHARKILGRKASGPIGTANWRTHLTEEDVRAIRILAAKQSLIDLSKKFGISKDAAYRIVTRRTWKHID